MGGKGSGGNHLTEQGKRQIALRQITHGGYSYLRTAIVPGCSSGCRFGETGKCKAYDEGNDTCPVILELQDQRIKQIMALDHVHDTDVHLVCELVKNLSFLDIVDRWLGCVSPFLLEKGDLKARAVLKMRWVSAHSVSRLCEQLGLSPSSRKALGLNGKASALDMASAMADINSEDKKNGRTNKDKT